jgi:hypothetical protein
VIVKQTVLARDDLARILGAGAAAPDLRFHPTTDDYERVTGQAWFTSGAMVNNELHLLPLAVLRDRGMRERSRHEPLHHDRQRARHAARLGPRRRGHLLCR